MRRRLSLVREGVTRLTVTKMLAFAFWTLSRFLKLIGNDGSSEWKAIALICVAEISLICAAAFGSIILMGHPLSLPFDLSPKVLIIAIACGLALVTRHVLYHQKLRTQYEAEFATYSKKAQVVSAVAILLFVVATTQVALFAAIHAHRYR
jgi:hypothetical protein